MIQLYFAWTPTLADQVREYQRDRCPRMRRELLDRLMSCAEYGARWASRKYRAEYDELLSVAVLGLAQAIDNYDPRHGCKIETHAVNHVRWAIQNEMTRARRHQTSSLCCDPPRMEADIDSVEAADVTEFLNVGLTNDEREIITGYYGRDESDRIIAGRFGVTKQAINARRQRAILTCREAMWG